MIGQYGRYLAGWAVVGAVLFFALTEVVPGVAGDSGRPAAIAGILVAALADLVVFALVLRAIAADATGFPKLWGLSIAVKVLIFGSAIALVAAREWFPLDGFIRALIVSFVVFVHHEAFHLVWGGKTRPRVPASGS